MRITLCYYLIHISRMTGHIINNSYFIIHGSLNIHNWSRLNAKNCINFVRVTTDTP